MWTLGDFLPLALAFGWRAWKVGMSVPTLYHLWPLLLCWSDVSHARWQHRRLHCSAAIRSKNICWVIYKVVVTVLTEDPTVLSPNSYAALHYKWKLLSVLSFAPMLTSCQQTYRCGHQPRQFLDEALTNLSSFKRVKVQSQTFQKEHHLRLLLNQAKPIRWLYKWTPKLSTWHAWFLKSDRISKSGEDVK